MRPNLELGEIPRVLRDPRTRKIAIAQPQTAPYGLAARAVMEHLGALAGLERKLVVGESIAQTAQFVETGNADPGFVALSLLQSPRLAGKGQWVEIPSGWHARAPLDPAAVLTRRGTANAAAQGYLEFLGGPAARQVLRAAGYRVP